MSSSIVSDKFIDFHEIEVTLFFSFFSFFRSASLIFASFTKAFAFKVFASFSLPVLRGVKNELPVRVSPRTRFGIKRLESS